MKLHRAALGLLFILPLTLFGQRTPDQERRTTNDGPRTTDLRLWFRQPAATWNEALPIGSGRLGAMVFGGVAEEHLQLNEDTVWAGEKRDRVNPAAREAVPEVRRLLFEGKAAEAEALADKAIISTPRRMPPYQTLGDLTLGFAEVARVRGYRRELDLTDAVARVRFTAGTTTHAREIFASAVDRVIVVRLTRQGPAKLTFAARLSRPGGASTRVIGDRLVMEGQALPADPVRHPDEPRTGARFAATVQAILEGGQLRADADALIVTDADAATLLIAAATDVRERAPLDACQRTLAAAASKPFTRLRADHIADYQRLFARVNLELGKTELGTQAVGDGLQAVSTDTTAASVCDHWLPFSCR